MGTASHSSATVGKEGSAVRLDTQDVQTQPVTRNRGIPDGITR